MRGEQEVLSCPRSSPSRASKSVSATVALDGLDLDVEAGEVHGFLGPNGAGKSTTLRVLLVLLRVNAGQVSLLGGDPWSDAPSLHRRLAYVPGDVNLWPNLTGGEIIDIFGRLRGRLNMRRRAQLIERFDLDPTKKGRSYSKGNRQKVVLVAALASDVELFLLDEPTSGLDPLMETIFQQCVRELRDDGRTVLLSSHILAEAEALSDRVSIIRDGRIVSTGTLRELRHLTRTTVTARTEMPADGLSTVVPWVDEVHHVDGVVSFTIDTDHLDEAMHYLSDLRITSLVAHPPTLEDLFLRHYGDRREEEPAQAGAR